MPNVGVVPVTTEQRVSAARRRLSDLESDIRLLPCEVASVRGLILGRADRPATLGQAHRYISALEERLSAATTEIPW